MSTSEPDPATGPGSEPGAPPVEAPGVRYGRMRRAPRYGSFLFTGAVVGVAVAILLAVVQWLRYHDSSQFSFGTVLGYVAATLGLLGAVVGAGVAVILDRRRS